MFGSTFVPPSKYHSVLLLKTEVWGGCAERRALPKETHTSSKHVALQVNPRGSSSSQRQSSPESNAEVRPSGPTTQPGSGIEASQGWRWQRSAPCHCKLCLSWGHTFAASMHPLWRGLPHSVDTVKQRLQGQKLCWCGQTYLFLIPRNVQPCSLHTHLLSSTLSHWWCSCVLDQLPCPASTASRMFFFKLPIAARSAVGVVISKLSPYLMFLPLHTKLQP